MASAREGISVDQASANGRRFDVYPGNKAGMVLREPSLKVVFDNSTSSCIRVAEITDGHELVLTSPMVPAWFDGGRWHSV